MVAGHLAKYSAKSTEATGHAATRITADSIDTYDADGHHIARRRRAGRGVTDRRRKWERNLLARRKFEPLWTVKTCRRT
jgi:hypothetical protein